MRKLLLGSLLMVGAVSAFGQANRVVETVDGTGAATANVGVEVTGKVVDPATKSLVVEIKSAPTADGRGFAIEMPDLDKNATSARIAGKFEAKVMNNNNPVALVNPIEVKLVDKAGIEKESIQATTVGTATDTTLTYDLTGKSEAGHMSHNGSIGVIATAGNTAGTYNDNTVQLRVKLTGQN